MAGTGTGTGNTGTEYASKTSAGNESGHGLGNTGLGTGSGRSGIGSSQSTGYTGNDTTTDSKVGGIKSKIPGTKEFGLASGSGTGSATEPGSGLASGVESGNKSHLGSDVAAGTLSFCWSCIACPVW